MLILILIHVQHSQKAVFSFEKGPNHQNHPLLRFPLPGKKVPPPTIKVSVAHPAIWKTLSLGHWVVNKESKIVEMLLRSC